MKKVLATAVALALAGLTGNAFAITDSEANAKFFVWLRKPGRKSSLGMGGAFVGLADDASAAYVNPSGLTQLVSPEVSAELRSERTDTTLRFQDGGNVPSSTLLMPRV
jgi:long-chain fatty acid transport protein